jgi:LacI family transcriptional regulator
LVADATRKRVKDSIERLGYVYNRAAATLRTQRSQAIGLVVTDITNPFFAQMTLGCEQELDAAAYALFLTNTSDSVERQAHVLRAMVARGVDGVLLCPARGTTPDNLALLHRYRIPYVLIARYLPSFRANYVGADNVTGAYLAVHHLAARGHQRIAFVGGADGSSARQDRLLGYRRALDESGIPIDPVLSIITPVSRGGGYEGIQTLLSQPDPPTAALCYNDVVAFGVMLGLQATGLTVGESFAVVGFDDIEEAALWRPALTTVSIPPKQVGEAAARLLVSQIAGPADVAQQVILAPRLVVRDSG